MGKPAANLRLFVAVYPPQRTIAALLKALTALDLPPHRTVPVEQVHLTLQFIGDVPAAELDAAIESVDRSVAGLHTFALAPRALITLPMRGPARLVAAEFDAPTTLAELHRRLATRFARNARHDASDRFRPHITLCRFRSPVHRCRVAVNLSVDLFEVDQVVLMRSTLSAEGAQHHQVAAWPLPPRVSRT